MPEDLSSKPINCIGSGRELFGNNYKFWENISGTITVEK